MFIEQIYIEKYGKFKNFNIEFKGGLNIIFGENEGGKSTLLNFILHILYGDNSRSRDLDKNLRVRYMPWKENQSRGYLVLNKDGLKYRIERVFDSIKKYDQLTVNNLLTGEEISLGKEISPGEYFFELNREEFLNLLFISSEKPSYSSDLVKADIRQRLINLKDTGDENISYSSVIAKLDYRIYKLQSKSKNKGILVEKIKAYEGEMLNYERAKEVEQKKSSEYRAYQKDLKALKLKRDKLGALRQMREITSKKSELKNDKKNYEDELLKDNRLANLTIELEKLEKDQKNLSEDIKKIDIKSLIFYGFSVLIFLALYLFNKVFILGILLSIIVFISKYLNIKRTMLFNRQVEVALSQLEGSIGARKENLVQVRLDFLEKNKFIKEKIFEIESQEAELLNTYKLLEQTHGRYIDGQEIKLAKEIEFDAQNLLDKKIDLSANYKLDKSSSSIYNGLEELGREIQDLKFDLDLLEDTKKELTEAYRELQKEFTPGLNDLASKIMEKISLGKYDELLVASDFNLTFSQKKNKDLIDFRYLSAGTIDQFYLALKLAIINLSIDKSLRILLLDDAFVRFDKKRFKESFKMLEDEFLDFSQIIYVTCKEDFKDLDLNFNLIYI